MCRESFKAGEYVEELKLRFTLKEEKKWIDNGEYGEWMEFLVCNWVGEKVTLKEIRKRTDNCPNCILAVLRQSKLNYKVCELEEFDYKKEFAEATPSEYKDKDRMAEYYGLTS